MIAAEGCGTGAAWVMVRHVKNFIWLCSARKFESRCWHYLKLLSMYFRGLETGSVNRTAVERLEFFAYQRDIAGFLSSNRYLADQTWVSDYGLLKLLYKRPLFRLVGGNHQKMIKCSRCGIRAVSAARLNSEAAPAHRFGSNRREVTAAYRRKSPGHSIP